MFELFQQAEIFINGINLFKLRHAVYAAHGNSVHRNEKTELQKLVLKIAVPRHLEYCRENGFRTPQTTLPFRILDDFSCLVEVNGAVGEN